MTENNITENNDVIIHYDYMIVGAGISGLLAALKLHIENPELKIFIAEQNTQIGGRMRSSKSSHNSGAQRTFGYGLNTITPELFDFIKNTINLYQKSAENSLELANYVNNKQQTLASLSGGKIRSIDLANILKPRSMQIIGGLAAKNEWQQISGVIDEDDSFTNAWSKTRKAPSALALSHFAKVFGVNDIWATSMPTLKDRFTALASEQYIGDFASALYDLLQTPSIKESVTIKTDCIILNAEYKEDYWSLSTPTHKINATNLIVAHPPWQALEWLSQNYWPRQIISLVNKTKPTSAVVLSVCCKNSSTEIIKNLPDITIITSENVQALKVNDDAICFQATIDFELSLQSPLVVKSVKKLRRAKSKLEKMFPDLVLENDFISLQPYAFSLSSQHKEARFLKALDKYSPAKNLAFCGDSYGSDQNSDLNIISSIVSIAGTEQSNK